MDKDGIIKELAERNAKLEEELQATKEHLKKYTVAFGSTHIVKVVVLSTSTSTLLNSYCPAVGGLFIADKIRFERHHASNGEQNRRVVGYQAR